MNWDHLQDWAQDEGPIKIKVFDQDVLLYFPYNHDAILTVKTIEGAEYAAHDKSWTLTVTEDNIKAVAGVIADLEQIFVEAEIKEKAAQQRRIDIAPLVLERLQRRFEHRHLLLDAEDEWITVSFPYHQKSLNAIKKIDGRKWDGDEKIWRLPSDEERQIRSALAKILRVLNAGKLPS
jgi:hypothetical protein